MQMFSVYDSKAAAYLPPFHSQTIATAIRAFEGAVRDEASPFHTHAADYTLFCIGSFDESTGILTAAEPHVSLGLADQYLVKTPFPSPALQEAK